MRRKKLQYKVTGHGTNHPWPKKKRLFSKIQLAYSKVSVPRLYAIHTNYSFPSHPIACSSSPLFTFFRSFAFFFCSSSFLTSPHSSPRLFLSFFVYPTHFFLPVFFLYIVDFCALFSALLLFFPNPHYRSLLSRASFPPVLPHLLSLRHPSFPQLSPFLSLFLSGYSGMIIRTPHSKGQQNEPTKTDYKK